MKLAALAKRAFPNALTLARLGVGLCFYWLPAEWRLGAVIFAALTDLADGWISRHLHVTSLWGKILDPIADKTCVLAVAITLLDDEQLKFWELLLVTVREIVVVGIAVAVLLIERHKLQEMPPRLSGKMATAGQFVFLVGQLAFASPPRMLFIVAAVLSAVAALDYIYDAQKRYRAYVAAMAQTPADGKPRRMSDRDIA